MVKDGDVEEMPSPSNEYDAVVVVPRRSTKRDIFNSLFIINIQTRKIMEADSSWTSKRMQVALSMSISGSHPLSSKTRPAAQHYSAPHSMVR